MKRPAFFILADIAKDPFESGIKSIREMYLLSTFNLSLGKIYF